MPFLRFTRDKRGYETTSLVHASRGQGRGDEQLLYWFRTAPSVKVGRSALDEEAIRWIESHNPDIEFDWPKILEAAPPPAPLSDEAKARRNRRVKPERRAAASQRPPGQRRAQPAKPQAPPRERTAEPVTQPRPEAAEPQPDAEVLAQLTRPDTEELPAPAVPVLDRGTDREQLARLRARYAELQARITERAGESANIESLRAQAAQLNPDSWVTEDEVRNGIAEFEAKIRDLRSALGLRRRRRSRRGGRKRRGGDAPTGQTDTAASTSDSPELPDGNEQDEE